jgi:hypothetical protein
MSTISFSPRAPVIHLILDDSVRAELGVSPDQVTHIGGAFHRARATEGMHYWERAKALWQDAISFLSDVQRKRLLELVLQYVGERAIVSEPDVQSTLAVTPEQLTGIHSRVEQFLMDRERALMYGRDEESSDAQKFRIQQHGQDPSAALTAPLYTIRKLQTQANSDIRSLLSKNQLAEWERQKGNPFSFRDFLHLSANES